MKMKCTCKENFEINDVLVAVKGDLLEVVDATDGYCDIHNLTTGKIYEATWSEAEDYEAITDVTWLD